MDKVKEAKEFLKAFGMPEKQQTDIAAYTLLTLDPFQSKKQMWPPEQLRDQTIMHTLHHRFVQRVHIKENGENP